MCLRPLFLSFPFSLMAFPWLIVGLILFPSQQSVEYHPRMVDHNAVLEESVFKQALQCVYFKLHYARQHMGFSV